MEEQEEYKIPDNQISKIPVASHLTDYMYKLLLTINLRHRESMGLEERKNYTVSDITKVEINIEDNCLNVHYNTNEWWHYTLDGKWY